MAWWRRRRSTPAHPSPSTDLVRAPAAMALDVVSRTERALTMLVFHAQQLDTRLTRIEARLDEQDDDLADLPTHGDVLDVRLHSARVAAELARMSVELRAQIEAATSVHHPAGDAAAARNHEELVVDLSARHHGSWAESA